MIALNSIYGKIFTFLFIVSTLGYFYFLFFEELENTLAYFFIYMVFNILGYVVFVKIHSIFIKLNFLIFYLGYLISMVVVFLSKENFTRYGWSGIGEYNFEPIKTFEALSVVSLYVFVFVLIAFVIDKLIMKPYFIKQLTINASQFHKLEKFRKYRHVFAVIVLFQIYLSYFMFQYKVGIIGLVPEPLPFRLAGILYYYRYIGIPIITMILLFSNMGYKNNFYIFIIILEAIMSGLFSVSKSVVVFHMIPVILYLVVVGRVKLNIFVFSLTFFAIGIASILRNFVYNLESLRNISVTELISFVGSYEGFSIEYFINIIGVLIARVGGYKEFFATYFNDLKYVDINLFISSTLGFQSFDYGNFETTNDIYGFSMPEGYAFGISIDPLSNLYLSSSSIFISIALIFLWILLLIGSEKFLNIVFSRYNKSLFFILSLNLYVLFAIVNPNVKNLFFYIPFYIFNVYLLYNSFLTRKRVAGC